MKNDNYSLVMVMYSRPPTIDLKKEESRIDVKSLIVSFRVEVICTGCGLKSSILALQGKYEIYCF